MFSADQVESFLAYLKFQVRFSHHTIDAYRRDLHQWLEVFEKKEKESQSAQIIIRNFLADLIKQGNQPTTVRRKLSALRRFHRFLKKNGHPGIPGITQISGPKIPEKLPEFLKVHEAQHIFSSTLFTTEEDLKNRDFNSSVNNYKLLLKTLIIRMLYMCGLRRDELIRLKESDIDFTQLEIRVTGKRGKQRIIPINFEIKRNLQTFISVKNNMGLRNDLLLVNEKNKKISPSFVYRSVREFLSAISALKKKSPHVLRHTFATHLLAEGANIQAVSELLGHSGLASTQVYAHVITERLKKAYIQAHPRSGFQE
jgi:integrase/recombinase XerC